jgi:hypothetical protein
VTAGDEWTVTTFLALAAVPVVGAAVGVIVWMSTRRDDRDAINEGDRSRRGRG